MDPIQQATQSAQPQINQPDPEQQLQATTSALSQKQQEQQQQQEQDSNIPLIKLPQQDNFSPAQISQAIATINPSGTSKAVQVGRSILTGNYAGYCLQWVDDEQKNNGARQPTAYADYVANANAGNIQTGQNIPDNARVYFAPDASNQYDGHVGLSNGDGTFTSATDDGVKTYKISDWQKLTGQRLIGWSTSNS